MTVQSMIQVCLMVILIWRNRTLRAHVPGPGRREEGLAKTKDGLLERLRLVMGYYNLCLPHLSLREALSRPIPTKGNGSPKKWIPRTPGTLVPALQVQVWLQVSLTICGRWESFCCSEYHRGNRR